MKKNRPSVAFSMVSQSLCNLVRFSTEGCKDSHIKIPKDIPEYLKKERIYIYIYFKKTRRNHLDYPKVKEDPFLRGILWNSLIHQKRRFCLRGISKGNA